MELIMHKCILVIDDSLFIRNKIIKTIRECISDAEVYGAADGKEAIHAMSQHPFQAIVCDLEMPNMNGNQFAEKIKKNPLLSRKNIIIYTSNPTAIKQEVSSMNGVYVVDKNNQNSLTEIVNILNKILGVKEH